ncbi:MAG: SLATT domain-containing protein [Jannaschia sp.]
MDGQTSKIQDQTGEVHTYASNLLYKMFLTKGARYQAARRHQRRSVASIWSVIALSMYVFTTSVVIALYDLNSYGDFQQKLTIANVVMSAFIIAFSVLEHGKKHDLKSDAFLRCAQGIQELRDRLELEVFEGVDVDTVRRYVEDYNEIVHDFADNHSETDYRTFRINIGKHSGQFLYISLQSIKYWVDCWLMMLAAMVVPPLAIGALFFVSK